MGNFNKDKSQALPCGLALKGDLQSNLAVVEFSVCSCRLCTLFALYKGHVTGFICNSVYIIEHGLKFYWTV